MNVSYAQNFEDVMLWRALGHIENGFYIDIGAQDPIIDSVSLTFHKHGWRGVHVEPTPHYADLLRQQRPTDKIIQAAISTGPGVINFFEIPGTGISTADSVIAQQHRERGFEVREITVVSITLAEVFTSCAEHDIHWLKIDVEGFEQQVLTSWSPSTMRPWVVVVESTLPLTQIESYQTWEPMLVTYGYTPVYFDGLNRYYISNAHPELQPAFQAPPNVFDGFSINGTASNPIHHLIAERHKQQISEIVTQNEQRNLATQNEVNRLQQSMMELNQTHLERQQASELRLTEIRTQLQAIQQQANAEKYAVSQQHQETVADMQRQRAEQERFAEERIQQLNHSLQQLQAEATVREQNHAESTVALQAELSMLLRERVEREQKVASQLLAMREQADTEKAEISQQHQAQLHEIQRQHAEHEWLTSERIQQLNHSLQQLQAEATVREQNHAESTVSLQVELSTLLGKQVEREQTLNQQLQAGQQERHSLEQALADMQYQLNAQLQTEREVSQQLQQVINTLQRELAILRNGLSWRLTAPLRGLIGLFKPAPSQIGNATRTAEQSAVEPISRPEPDTTTPDTQELTSNCSLSEITSMTIDRSAQEAQTISSTAVPNLNALLQYQDHQFVEFAYLTLLKRRPDVEGFNYYLGRLRAGIPKIQILGQLLDSYEALRCGVELPELRNAVRRQKLAKLPLIGTVIKHFIKIEGDSDFENRLRAIEQQNFLFSKQFEERLGHVDKNLNELRQLIIQQSQKLSMSLQQPLATTIAAVDAAIEPVDAAIEQVSELNQSKTSGDLSHGVFSMMLAEVYKWPLGRRVNE